MDLFQFALRGVTYFWRSHLGTLLGAMVGTGVLAGALFVGDSVRGSLRLQALYRSGGIEQIVTAGDRFFGDGLAGRIAEKYADGLVTSGLLVRGVATSGSGDTRANQIQILGIHPEFWELDPTASAEDKLNRGNGVWINATLAAQLKVQAGSGLLLRIEKPALLTRESALTPQEDYSVAFRTTVAGVLPQASLGQFSLYSGQSAVRTAFVPIGILQDMLEQSGKANVIFAGLGTGNVPGADGLLKAIRESWSLEDAALNLAAVAQSPDWWELRSPRVFLEKHIESSAIRTGDRHHRYLTWFVNTLSVIASDRETPYSMVTGTDDDAIIQDCPPGGIVLNQWIADDLGVTPGESLQLEYYVMGQSNRLEIRTSQFRVHAIIPLSGAAADRSLMPDFPGVAQAESTRDWDAGFPLDMDKIRDKDEHYWKEFKGTPKAFIRLDEAQSLWANRFGDLTSVRISGIPAADLLSSNLLAHLDPASLGFQVTHLKQDALASASESFDFGQLFLSFSFFLILSAAMLVVLFFQFGLERRLSEVGILSAMGFRPSRIRTYLFLEGSAIAVAGSLLGMVAGKFYAQAMVHGLTTAWKDAVAEAPIQFFATPGTAVSGFILGVVTAIIAMAFVFWKYSRTSVSRLLVSQAAALPEASPARGRLSRFPIFAFLGFLGAMGLLIPGWTAQGPAAAGCFFGSGVLALVALHLLFNRWLISISRSSQPFISAWQLALKNMSRRPRRTMAVVASLASGGFLVTAMSPFQMDASADASIRQSGTGGFALYGRSSLPIVHDLNTSDGRDFFGFDPDELDGLEWVPMRLRDGDDASCLNLNMARLPRVLGVDPKLLSDPSCFQFAGAPWPGLESPSLDGWNTLDVELSDGSIPAIIDGATMQWALHRKLGDILEYPGPDGAPVRIRLVAALQGSMLQGSLVISESHFRKIFPEVSGSREFLINAADTAAVSGLLTRAMQDFGMEITPTIEVMNRFNAVQNTYLSTFQLLGQLGVLLGSLGIAVIALRNVHERVGELGLLEAVGFRRSALRWQVGLEHWLLLVLGLAFGLLAATLAVLPPVLNGAQSLSMLPVLTSLGWILLSGSLWVGLAINVAFRGHFRDALREL